MRASSAQSRARELIPINFQCGIGTNQPRFNRLKRRPDEIRGKDFLDRLHLLRRLQQASAPLCENRCNLVDIFFRDELIGASMHFEQSVFEWQLRPIVRVKMKLAL